MVCSRVAEAMCRDIISTRYGKYAEVQCWYRHSVLAVACRRPVFSPGMCARSEHPCPGDNVDLTANMSQRPWCAQASRIFSVCKPMLAKRSSICGPETPPRCAECDKRVLDIANGGFVPEHARISRVSSDSAFIATYGSWNRSRIVFASAQCPLNNELPPDRYGHQTACPQ